MYSRIILNNFKYVLGFNVVWDSLSLSLCVSLSIISLSLSLSLCVSLSLYLSLSVSVCVSLYLSLSVSVCLSLYISLSLSLCVSLSLYLSLSLSLCVSLSLYLSLSLSLSLCVRAGSEWAELACELACDSAAEWVSFPFSFTFKVSLFAVNLALCIVLHTSYFKPWAIDSLKVRVEFRNAVYQRSLVGNGGSGEAEFEQLLVGTVLKSHLLWDAQWRNAV